MSENNEFVTLDELTKDINDMNQVINEAFATMKALVEKLEQRVKNLENVMFQHLTNKNMHVVKP